MYKQFIPPALHIANFVSTATSAYQKLIMVALSNTVRCASRLPNSFPVRHSGANNSKLVARRAWVEARGSKFVARGSLFGMKLDMNRHQVRQHVAKFGIKLYKRNLEFEM